MEKKLYQTPHTEQIYININGNLLDWSAPMPGGDGNTGDDIIDINAKQNNFDDDFDFLDDEEIEAGWSFNVWED